MFLGLFKLRDVTKLKLVINNMTQQDFIAKLSAVTDQATNTGFLSKNKKFHGLVNSDRFRLKRIQTLLTESFVIKGEIKKDGKDLIINLEFIRAPLFTILPTFIFVTLVIGLFRLIKEGMDWRYLPFLGMVALLLLWVFETKKQGEIEKIKKLLTDIINDKVD